MVICRDLSSSRGILNVAIPLFLLAVLMLGSLYFSSCSQMRPVSVEVDEEKAAREAYSMGDYELALEEYERLIEDQRDREEAVDGRFFNCAGLAAFSMGMTSRALDHLERARHTDAADAQTFAALAMAYRDIDNLSREITHLENYLTNYPEGELTEEFRIRYFETLVESKNYQQAYDLWPELDEGVKDDDDLMHQYFEVNLALEHEDQADELAETILEFDGNNMVALDRLAKKYFYRAETLYQQEMEAYNKNRTHKQYAQLLEAFEQLGEDFRTSLKYFLRLYELNPTREYASFLRNIYARFENDERVKYYEKQLEE